MTALSLLRGRTRVRRAARLVLGERFEVMWACLPAALAGDPESGIHTMRVESKRLREAMRLFRRAYRTGEFEWLVAEVDKLNDRLGLVRDADVLGADVGKLIDDPDEPLTALRDALAVQRGLDQEALLDYLRELEASGFAEHARRLIREGRHSASHRIGGRRLRAFAPMEIGRRMRRVLRRIKQVQSEQDVHGLHEVRIGNKQLRYAMETLAGIYDRRFEQALDSVVDLHKALGDVHDLDVLLGAVEKFQSEGGGVSPDSAAQLTALRARRERLYGRLEHLLTPKGARTFGRTVLDALG